MTEIISVRFKSGGKEYYFDPRGTQVRAGQGVIDVYKRQLLDSVKRTIQCAFSPANPDSLNVWFCAADGSALKLDNLGVTLPIDQPYSHSLLDSLLMG